ncbi:MAG: helix-turn-helix domain-containing protein [Lachnospiraceae bacterium]
MGILQNENKNNSVVLVDFHNSKLLREHGVSFHWWNSEPTSLHCHNFYEFFIITDGTALHELNGERFELRKGTLHLIKPEDVHRISSVPDGNCVHMNLSICAEKLQKLCDAIDISLEELLGSSPLKTVLSVEETEFFTRRAEKIALLNYNGDARSHVIVCELISQAVFILYKAAFLSRSDYPDWFTGILEKIHSPEFSNCTASDIYQLGGFSPPAMIEYFKEYTGQTVSEYLRGVKLKHACELLKNTELPILELSNLLGYASLSHFNRLFKKHTGVSPAAYRKSKRKRTLD